MNPRFSIKKGARASRPLRYHKPAGETPTLPYSTRTRTGRPLRYHKPAGETPTLPYSTRMRVGRPLRYHQPAGGTPTLLYSTRTLPYSTPALPWMAFRGVSSTSRGVALVMVLTIVVLVAVASVAFFAAISLERQSSAAYANSGEARIAADSAVNLVMGQIREATEKPNVVWTSQPGLLRTFSASGTPKDVYKLYSSFPMRMSASAFNPADDVSTNFPSTATVDLNRPTSSRVGGTNRLTFPILDPRASGKVEGFDISNWSHNGTSSLPMPVAWMYVAKNGNLTTWDNLDPDNPPIARIAFWTDDETSKININTASEGNFWDIPRTATGMQTWVNDGIRGAKSCYSLAVSQPAQREYQSYPGHPATTSLSPVLWKYFQAIAPSMNRSNRGPGSFPETLYSMLPRTSGNGSMGGTVELSYGNPSLPAKTERLYSSVDELAFDPPSAGSSNRTANSWFPRDTIEQTRFFLTAYNRAPELNLFNLPRVTIWPVHRDTGTTRRTPFDNLIAFASTINDLPFYFQRFDPNSTTNDYNGIARNQTLYSYLQNLTARPIPGFGSGTFQAKYSQDRDQILTEILDYVRCTNVNDTSSADPAFQTYALSGKVAWVAGEGRNNTVTLPGTAQVLPLHIGSTSGFGRVPTINRVLFHLAAARDVELTDGNGTLTGEKDRELEAALYFESFVATQGYPILHPDFEIRVTGSFSLSTNGSSGNITTLPMSFTGSNVVTGYANWGIGGYQGYFANTFTYTDGTIVPNVYQKPKALNDALPARNYPFVVQGLRLPLKTPATPDTPPQDITVTGGTLTVQLAAKNGGPVFQTFQLTLPSFTTTMPKVAVIPENKPGPIPGYLPLVPSGIQARFGQFVPGWGWLGLWNYRQLSSRLPDATSSSPQMTYKPQTYSMYLFREEDVVRSLEPIAPDVLGDLRVVAASPTTNTLEAMPGAGGTSQRVFSAMSTISEAQLLGQYAHWYSGWNGLTGGNFSLNDNQSWGRLVKDNDWQGPSSQSNNPEYMSASVVPAAYNGVLNHDGAAGDFDTGVGSSPDGPYVNKSDEGSVPAPGMQPPYVRTQNGAMPPGQTFSSPSRQLPSAVAFGSLPSGVKAGHPWQTLLFNPVPASLYGATNPGTAHAGSASPPDHLLLDLFHMPVVEPYAISEPFSTAGKVNMNYEIIPFTGIERSTALHGALYPVRVTAIRSSTNRSLLSYKDWAAPVRLTYRYPVNVPETLKSFQDRFADNTNGHVFKSASEICEIPLVPSNDTSANATIPLIGDPYGYSGTITRATLGDFWKANRVTGDNLREQPYNVLYPRLTTRSNTFTVHVWVQTLKKLPGTNPTQWVEGKDRVTAEYRGSYLIERYLNPAEAGIPDYASNPTGNLNTFYRFRIISAKQFDP